MPRLSVPDLNLWTGAWVVLAIAAGCDDAPDDVANAAANAAGPSDAGTIYEDAGPTPGAVGDDGGRLSVDAGASAPPDAGRDASIDDAATAVTAPQRPNCEDATADVLPELELVQIASGLDEPLYLSPIPDDDSRLVVVQRNGLLRVIRDGELLPEPMLDIRDRVATNFSEMGLLGLAFHPLYAENRRLFVAYSSNPQNSAIPPHDGVLAEFQTAADDPDRVDEATAERRLLIVAQPEGNHNGGALAFGPDGLLYVALGDGGGNDDLHGAVGNGQALDTLLGKILRLDVNGRAAGEYTIPDGNLAQSNPTALPEIWSYGLRNPWRFSFDACTGDMYVADVGQNDVEEVNFEPVNTVGRNYGWRRMEGNRCFNPGNCDPVAENLTLPVASYPHSGADVIGSSVTGGYVYRGAAIPALRGTYLYADYGSDEILALRMQDGELAQPQTAITENLNPGREVQSIISFGQDNAGELYVVSLAGSVYRIDPE